MWISNDIRPKIIQKQKSNQFIDPIESIPHNEFSNLELNSELTAKVIDKKLDELAKKEAVVRRRFQNKPSAIKRFNISKDW